MKKTTLSSDQGLDDLFEKYQKAPDSYVFVPLADACRKIGRFDEALEICEKGVVQHPDYASGHVVKGKCLYDRGDFDAACETFERVLDLDDNNLVALKFLGMIAAEDGHLDTARNYFQKILAVDPDNKDITRILRDVEVREKTDGIEDVLVAAAPDVASDERPAEGASATSGDAGESKDSPEVAETIELEDASESVGTSETTDASESANASESADTSESVDASEPADSNEFSDPNEITISNEPADPGEPENSTDSVETSEELASITLADIFASQGYTSKAEKIYREVLKKQPSNEAVRKKLEALTDAPESEDAAGDDFEAGTGDIPVKDDTMPDQIDEVSEFVELTDDADSTGRDDSVSRSRDAVESESNSKKADSNRKATNKAANEAVDPADEENRPAIDDSDSMSHFRQWLKQMQK